MNLYHIVEYLQLYFDFDNLFFQNIINSNWIEFYVLQKDKILYWINIYNFIHYILYKRLKFLMINIYYYFIQMFLLFIYNNMPNFFVGSYIYYYYRVKNTFFYYKKYLSMRFVKPYRFWRIFYRFHHISYLRVLFFILLFILFILMWKRRNTYLKRTIIVNLILFYLFSVMLSYLFWPLFVNKFISICLSLFLAFFLICLKLN